MLAISDELKNKLKEPIHSGLRGRVIIDDDTIIADEDDLIQFKITSEATMCQSAMKTLEIKYKGDLSLLDKQVHPQMGMELSDGTIEYIDYGTFLITTTSYAKDTDTTTATGYDLMVNSMVEYTELDIEYPIGLYDYAVELCNAFGLELLNESFDCHNDWEITEDLWLNIDGITYRDILVQIAQVTATTCIISEDKVYFKPITQTSEVLDYDTMKKWTIEEMYGPINSIVLSRSEVEDNIYLQDEESIETYGLTEFKIADNEIVDDDRESAMTEIYNHLVGISYYPFEITTIGLAYFEIADGFDIEDSEGNIYNTALFNYSITIGQSISETLKTEEQTKTETQYQYATIIEKTIHNTYVKVDKQEQQIEALVEKVDGNSSQLSEIDMTLENITSTVSQTTEDLETLQTTVEQNNSSVTTTIEEILEDIENGTETLSNTMVTIDINGISVATSESAISTLITNDSFIIMNYDEVLAQFNNDGAFLDNLTVNTYFTAGYHRAEKFSDDDTGEDRTGWFYVGGDG